LQSDFLGDIKAVTKPVDADVAIFSDRGSTPLASTIKNPVCNFNIKFVNIIRGVIVQCWGLVRGDRLQSKLQAAPNWIGLSIGFLLMYVTALFVTG
jgi:hypothetical protein